MLWSAVLQLFNIVFQYIVLCLKSDYDKELEILNLRKQLHISQRHNQRVIRPERDDKFFLTVLTQRFKQMTASTTTQLQKIISILQPETVLRWHRELVRRKWTFDTTTSAGGRPPIATELELLVIQLARENDWGYDKILANFANLAFVSAYKASLTSSNEMTSHLYLIAKRP